MVCDSGHSHSLLLFLHFDYQITHRAAMPIRAFGFLCSLICYCTQGDLHAVPQPNFLCSTRFCWICGRPVSLENNKTDEHGNVVHRECYTARLKLRQAGSPVMKKQPTPPKFTPPLSTSIHLNQAAPFAQFEEWALTMGHVRSSLGPQPRCKNSRVRTSEIVKRPA
jgi:hypothetical protein